jgi:hypothetical protein
VIAVTRIARRRVARRRVARRSVPRVSGIAGARKGASITAIISARIAPA